MQLQIVNSLGQTVRMLVNGPLAAGLHEMVWDGRNPDGQMLSSGTYRVVLQSAEGMQAQTITLVK